MPYKPPPTKVHRNIPIRCEYCIRTDSYHAVFDLPEERRKQSGFQRVVRADLPKTGAPGKYEIEGLTESEVLTQAQSMIDDYLGEE